MGAQVQGVDLARPLDDDTFAAIRDAFHRHLLLRFPAQRLSEPQQLAFSRRFGELQVHVLDQYRHPQYPQIYVLSNVDRETGRTIGHHPDKGTLAWHSDLSFQRRPALATILYGIETPSVGGQTQFADMNAAYDALDAAMKRRIDGLRAVHDLDVSRGRMGEPPMTPRTAPPGAAGVASAGAHAPRHRPQVAVRQRPCLAHRRAARRRKRRVARRADGARNAAALRLQLSVAAERRRDVGQPLHDAPGDCATTRAPSDA